MHIKPQHPKALQEKLISSPTGLSTLIFPQCASRGGDTSEPRRGNAQEPDTEHLPSQRITWSSALKDAFCSQAAPPPLLYSNPKVKRIFGRPQSRKKSLRCCKSVGCLALFTLPDPGLAPSPVNAGQCRCQGTSTGPGGAESQIHAARTLQMHK